MTHNNTFLKRFCALLLSVFLVAPAMAQTTTVDADDGAALKLELNEGLITPMPIAIASFLGGDASTADFGNRIRAVVENDLVSSGLFRSVPRSAHIETIEDFAAPPRFPDWKAINSEALVYGQISLEPDGRLRVQFRLWDVFAQQQLQGLQYFTGPDNWRRVAHKVADAIYSRLTGETGYFDTRVVFIAESGPKNARIKRLAIMDQDSAGLRNLTSGDDLVLTPRFSPVNQEVLYISYAQGAPQVFLYNIDTGRREVLGNFPGMSFAPRFSPDGTQVVMSLTRGGNTDLYIMGLAGRNLRRLTQSPAIDTAPSFSPDGSQIVFESDRGGSQQIYVMSAGGGAAQRISFGEARYGTPVWSPRGDKIAFTRISKGQFSVGVMSPDGSGEQVLSSSFLDEGPTWAPNGRVLMFFRETPGARGGPSLYSVDLTGQNLRKVQTPGFASDPAWSPLLP